MIFKHLTVRLTSVAFLFLVSMNQANAEIISLNCIPIDNNEIQAGANFQIWIDMNTSLALKRMTYRQNPGYSLGKYDTIEMIQISPQQFICPKKEFSIDRITGLGGDYVGGSVSCSAANLPYPSDAASLATKF